MVYQIYLIILLIIYEYNIKIEMKIMANVDKKEKKIVRYAIVN